MEREKDKTHTNVKFNLLPLFVTAAAATAVYRIALPFLKLQQPAAFSLSTFFQPVVVAVIVVHLPFLSLSLLYKLAAERKKEKESASIGA